MPRESNDFTDGRSCILCGSFFEENQNTGLFAHGERVACIECYDALSQEGQSMSKKALVSTKKNSYN